MSTSRSLALFAVLGLVLLAAGIGAGVWLFCKDATPKSDDVDTDLIAVCFGRVDVESGVVPLNPPQPGRVESVKVKEGDKVCKKELLLVMDRQFANNLVEEARQDLKAAEARLDQAQKLGEQQKLREAQQQAVIDAVKARVKAAEAVRDRKQQLFERQQLNAKDVEVACAQVEEARAMQSGEEKKLAELKLNNPGAEFRRAEADVDAKKARLAQAKLGLEECKLLAPSNGTVVRVSASPGESLGAQTKQPAILFAPDKPLIVRAEIEQEFASRVDENQSFNIEDDANNANDSVKWKGKLERMSDWYAQRRSIMLEPGQLNDVRTLEAIIRVTEGPIDRLRIGQRVRVIISKPPPSN
jgi:multidrug resistance efflux pump